MLLVSKCAEAFLPHKPLGKIAVAFVYLAIYFGVGVLVYRSVETNEDGEPWTIVECLYFCAVVMSTVGYGDYSPKHGGTRLFTIFYIFVGIIVVFSAIGQVMAFLMEPVNNFLRGRLELLFPQEGIDVDGNGKHDYKVPRAWYIYYPKNLLPEIIMNVLLQQLSALVFVAIEDWDYGTAMYHCWVTASTVGFGDISIETEGGRMWAIVHICMSVCFLASFIADVDVVRTHRKTELKRKELLTRKLDKNLITSLDKDGKGVDKFEFVTGMLIKMELVCEQDVTPFVIQFESLNATTANKDGKLHYDDLQAMAKGYQDRAGLAVGSKAPSVAASSKVVPGAPTEQATEVS